MGKDGKLYRSEIQQNPQESVDREYFPDLRGSNKPTIFTKDDKTVKVGFNFAPSPIQAKPRPSSSRKCFFIFYALIVKSCKKGNQATKRLKSNFPNFD